MPPTTAESVSRGIVGICCLIFHLIKTSAPLVRYGICKIFMIFATAVSLADIFICQWQLLRSSVRWIIKILYAISYITAWRGCVVAHRISPVNTTGYETSTHWFAGVARTCLVIASPGKICSILVVTAQGSATCHIRGHRIIDGTPR